MAHDFYAFFISNDSTTSTEDQKLPGLFGFFGDPPPEVCYPTLEAVSLRDFRPPEEAI